MVNDQTPPTENIPASLDPAVTSNTMGAISLLTLQVRELQESLRQSEQRCTELLELAQDAIITHSQGLCISANPAATRLLGAARSMDLVGRPIMDLIHPSCRSRALEGIQYLNGTRRKPIEKLKFFRIDGQPVEVEVLATSVTHQGAPAVQMVLRDISKRKRLDRNLRATEFRYRLLFTKISEAFALYEVLFDLNGEPNDLRIIDLNPAFETMTGMTRTDLVGKTKCQCFPDSNLEWVRRHGRIALAGGAAHFHYYSSALDRHFEVFAYSPSSGHLACLYLDVTIRKQAEEEREITIKFLRLVNSSTCIGALIESAVNFFRERSGCEALGLRLRKGHDYPYYEARGFPAEFLVLENSLCSLDSQSRVRRNSHGNAMLDCMCGCVINGSFGSMASLANENGTFWTNSCSSLAASLSQQSRKRVRGRCPQFGYQSMALIPLRVGTQRLGLLQMNDSRKNVFSPHLISRWERLADHLAVALAKFQAEDALRQNDARLKTVLENSTDAAYQYDLTLHRYDYVSPVIQRLIGFSINEFIQLNLSQILSRIHPEDRARVEMEMKKAAQSTSSTVVEYRFQSKSEGYRWLADRSSVVKNEFEHATHRIGVLSDITDKKHAEESLLGSEWRATALLNAITEPIALIDNQGAILAVNSVMARGFDNTVSNLLGKNIFELMPPDLAQSRGRKTEQVIRTGKPIRFEDSRAGVYFSNSIYPVLDSKNCVIGMALFAQDITERKSEAEARRKSDLRFQHLVDSNIVGVMTTSGETIIEANDIFLNMVGYTREDLKQGRLSWKQLTPPEFADWDNAALQSLFKTNKVAPYEKEFYHKNGGRVPILIGAASLLLTPLQCVCFVLDLTENRRAQEAIQKAHNDLEQKVTERTLELRQANLTLRTMFQCNQAVVQETDETKLIQTVCQIIYSSGRYMDVWAGFAEHDKNKTVRLVGFAGNRKVLSKLKVSWDDNEHGRGPTGTAIRTGKTCITELAQSNPTMRPWMQIAAALGFGSAISLPLMNKGLPFGALTLYSAESTAVDPEQATLLREFADNLAFGIVALRARTERDEALKNLELKTTQLRALASQLTAVEERERRRLAQILHDNLQQWLVGARYNMQFLKSLSSNQVFQETVKRVDDMLRSCLDTSRLLTAELSPRILFEIGLGPALKWLGEQYQQKHGVIVHLKICPVTVEEDAAITLFQAVRELLFNVVKHAGVKSASVSLGETKLGQTRIVVNDQGAGFDATQLRAKEGTSGSFGLFSLRERLELIGGTLVIKSSPGRGSRFTITIPKHSAPKPIQSTSAAKTNSMQPGQKRRARKNSLYPK